MEFRKPLHHRNDVPTDFLRQHRRLDEFGVFESVADDRRVVVGQSDHRQQFRLAARFQTEVVGLAKLQHLLDNLPLLVDLHGIDAAVIAAVSALLHGMGEGPMDLPQAMLQDFAKPQQNGQIDPANLQTVDKRLEIDALGWILVRVHQQVAVGAHREIAVSPAGHLIEIGGVSRAPLLHIKINCHQGGSAGGIFEPCPDSSRGQSRSAGTIVRV